MRTCDIFKNKTVFSFEVFPPKKTSPVETVYKALNELKDLRPDFISVTYGAGGSENCDTTLDIVKRVKNVCGVESVSHLTCTYLTKDEATKVLETFRENGVENILALRGDKIEGREPAGDFLYASDLVKFIREFDSKRNDGEFNILGACYPEGHPTSKSMIEDIQNLKIKVDYGVTHLMSQLFFDNNYFYDFLEKTRIAGINVPIEAGIMPVVNKKQIERMVNICGVALPKKYSAMMDKYGDNTEAIRDAGIAYAIDQIVDLVSQGVDGVHLYTMNNPYVAKKINDAVRSLF
ncbi:MAG: methylenetetrahydrofolate reductase [NAD(P)H] [Treponema sp.]|nr:methylenetetrahydrofolate reductase [NAD(P)H] [Treponema sp.]